MKQNGKFESLLLNLLKRNLSFCLVVIDLHIILVLILIWQHLSAACLLRHFPPQIPHLPEVVPAATRDVGDAAKQQVWRMGYFLDGKLEPSIYINKIE